MTKEKIKIGFRWWVPEWIKFWNTSVSFSSRREYDEYISRLTNKGWTLDEQYGSEENLK